ncbi:hypothetical protein RHO12_11505 [Orbus sturtevantii]|uniref:hypothetical protein n=1 Tax=Orbus sturtevantii TaxID=3074109 RepID=UPI00370D7131
MEGILYDKKLIEKNQFSFQELSKELPIKILVGELDELKIYRIYSSIEDYEDDNYSVVISSKSGINFQINHHIYLRYNTTNQLIGFDIEKVSNDGESLQFYSNETLKKLVHNGINPQEMQAVINIGKIYLYTAPSETEIDNKYLVYLDKVTLLDEYKDSKGIFWSKIMFNNGKSGQILAWVQSDKIKFDNI